MYKILASVFLALLILGCNPKKPSASGSMDYLPENGFALIKINNLSAFNSDLKNNHFLNSWEGTSVYGKLAGKLAPLQYLQSNSQAMLAFYQTKGDSIDYLLAAPYLPDLFTPDKAVNFSKETFTYKDLEMQKYMIDGLTLYGITADNQLLLSSSDSLIRLARSVPSGFGNDPNFASLDAAASRERNATFYLKVNPATQALGILLQPESQKKLSRFSNWVSLDFGSQQDYLSLNGIALASDSMPNFVGLFRDTRPLPLRTPAFAPQTAKAVIAYAMEDYGRFSVNRQFFARDSILRDSLFQAIEEIGLIFDAPGQSVLLNTIGSENISSYLSEHSTGSVNYRNHEIHMLEDEEILIRYFAPLINDFKASYYTILENALIFSSDLEPLNNIIDHYTLGSTFDKTSIYTEARQSLADEANILMVAGKDGIENLVGASLGKEALNDLRETDLSEYSISAQLVAEGSFYHTTLMMRKVGADSNRATNTRYTVKLDAPMATEPQLVINHRTNKREIVVQDEDNNLYLISTAGKVLWKKSLGSMIQGTISQVDLYRNGRLQLAFTTDNRFIILDRNGKEVAPFNMSYPGGNLNPLAVFDYDSNKNYRFVISQGDAVYMYDRQGRIVRGFTYTKAESPVLPSPQHIRFGNKDFLVFRLENGELKILDRVGRTRVKVNEKIDFSGNEVYGYKNQFALTDKQGNLYLIDEKGKISVTGFDLNQDHGMEATSKSMAIMNENVLKIKGKEVVLDYGVYTAPRIFYIYDAIYVSVTDLQSHKTYLFNSSAQLIPGFPVLGSSGADLADMDNDRKLELVVKGQDDSLIVYSLN
jgi:hypothetical protein